jgi:hypothetical protein
MSTPSPAPKTTPKPSPSDEDIAFFKQWLVDNGANFSKVEWPSADTNSGIRGAVALDDIATNEHMVSIPSKLMISPESAFADPVAGEFFKLNLDILRGKYIICHGITSTTVTVILSVNHYN